MTDPNQPSAAPVNPASVASNPNPSPSQNNPNAQPTSPSADPKQARTSTIVTNPPSAEAPVEKKPEASSLPQSTIDEMNSGKKALERNRPVAQALEAARGDAPAKE